ncbi:MAG: hypothetical protein NTY53_23540 [Kiritimatiellaeota bacterium]|nr:hypothetical protein [Kiritimatiellota bacterium]
MNCKLMNLVNKFLLTSFFVVCGYVSIKLFYFHLSLILFKWPIQFRETAILLSTDMLLKGGNPYLLENFPMYTNVYGILYNLVTCPVAALMGCTLTVHKAVGGFFTLCCGFLVYAMLRRSAGVSRSLAWGGALIVYASLLYSKTSLAEPDSLGLFLYLLTITLPIAFRFSPGSLVASVLAGIAAFYTKPYFVIALPIVGLYLFLFVSWKKGLVYVLLSSVLFAIMAVLVGSFCETYFYVTCLFHQNTAGRNPNWVKPQWIQFGHFNRELLIAAVIAAGSALFSRMARKGCREASPPANGSKTLIFRGIYLPLFALPVVAWLFSYKLGLNGGAYMTYLYQLVTPLFILALFPHLGNGKGEGWQFVFLPLVAASLLLTSGSYHDINKDFRQHDGGNWQKALDYVSTHTNILAVCSIAPLLFAQGKPVYDSGHSGCFGHDALKAPPRLSFFFPLLEQLRRQDLGFNRQITTGLVSKRFDLLMLNRQVSEWMAPPDIIAENYILFDHLSLYHAHDNYSWDIDIWKPKK